jgi:hypothetical protein
LIGFHHGHTGIRRCGIAVKAIFYAGTAGQQQDAACQQKCDFFFSSLFPENYALKGGWLRKRSTLFIMMHVSRLQWIPDVTVLTDSLRQPLPVLTAIHCFNLAVVRLRRENPGHLLFCYAHT